MVIGSHRMHGGDIMPGAVSPGATGPFMVHRDISGTLPERMRVIVMAQAANSDGWHKVVSDTVQPCAWTRPASWDASGRLIILNTAGHRNPGTELMRPGVIAREAGGVERLRSICGRLIHLDGTGRVHVEASDGARHTPFTHVFLIHDPERTTIR
ncbi:hypothetical protein [Streptomyces lavendofoliae]|uniref:hypothetical protein n=1 Tax=Streptomyces lavendofoliae TaxID=67314 RepID=UPI003D8A4CA8